MSIDSLSAQIERMTLEVPRRARGLIKKPELHVGSRVLAIRELLNKNAGYTLDCPLAKRVLQLMDTITSPHSFDQPLKELRSNLESAKPRSLLTPLREALSRMEKLCLSHIWGHGEIIDESLKYRVPEEHLKTMCKDTFWHMIKEMKIDSLVIDRPNKSPLVYSEYVLDRLIVNKVELTALTEEYTLRFDTGETIEEVTRAFLSLCGDFFTRQSFRVFKESVNNVIEIRGVSLNGFCGILAMVNTRELDKDIMLHEYIHCKNHLSFNERSNSGLIDNHVQHVEVVDHSDPATETALNALPPDALRHIFANVSNTTFLNCRLVCRKWNAATQLQAAWANRIFPLTLSAGNIPPFATFFSPLHYDEHEEQWLHFKSRIVDIVTAAKAGDATARLLVAERVYLKQGNYDIDRVTALDWLFKARADNEAKVEYIFGVDSEMSDHMDTAVMYFQFSAEKGYAKAQNRLGMLYQEGKGVAQSAEEAEKWYLRAAEQGNIFAQSSLTTLYYNSNPAEALKWSLVVAKKGCAKAQNRAGVLLYNNKQHPNYVTEGLYWLKLAARQGHVQALCNLGNIYRYLKNFKEAFTWYKLAADKNHPDAQNNLGLLYNAGQGVPQDLETAAYWFLLSATQDNAEAQYNLGTAHFEGRGIPVDVAEGFKWYLLAARQGFYDADYKVAQIYREGEGVIKNMEEAIQWLHVAADRGNIDACYDLGVLYEQGTDVAFNIKEAAKWYLAAAKKGHMNAQYCVGRMYETPEVALNLPEAFNWYLKAAKQGHKYASHRVGTMYEHGVCVAKDIKEALKWYRLAALGSFGSTKDKQDLETLIEKLSAL